MTPFVSAKMKALRLIHKDFDNHTDTARTAMIFDLECVMNALTLSGFTVSLTDAQNSDGSDVPFQRSHPVSSTEFESDWDEDIQSDVEGKICYAVVYTPFFLGTTNLKRDEQKLEYIFADYYSEAFDKFIQTTALKKDGVVEIYERHVSLNETELLCRRTVSDYVPTYEVYHTWNIIHQDKYIPVHRTYYVMSTSSQRALDMVHKQILADLPDFGIKSAMQISDFCLTQNLHLIDGVFEIKKDTGKIVVQTWNSKDIKPLE
jgi:hypothetical protein